MECITVNPKHRKWNSWNPSAAALKRTFAEQRENFIADVGFDAFWDEFPEIGHDAGDRPAVRAHGVQAATASGAGAAAHAAPAVPKRAPPKAPPPAAEAPPAPAAQAAARAHAAHTQAISDQMGNDAGQLRAMTGQLENQAGQLRALTDQMENQSALIRDTHEQVEHQAGELREMKDQVENQAGQFRQLREMNGQVESYAHDEQFRVLADQVNSQVERIRDLRDQLENQAGQLRAMTDQIEDQAGQLHAINSKADESWLEVALSDMDVRIRALEESLDKKNAAIHEKIEDMQNTLENLGAGVRQALGSSGLMEHDMVDAMRRIHNTERVVEQHGLLWTQLQCLLARYWGPAWAPQNQSPVVQ